MLNVITEIYNPPRRFKLIIKKIVLLKLFTFPIKCRSIKLKIIIIIIIIIIITINLTKQNQYNSGICCIIRNIRYYGNILRAFIFIKNLFFDLYDPIIIFEHNVIIHIICIMNLLFIFYLTLIYSNCL